jgi:hypothetical protein
VRSSGIVAAVAVALALSACGGGARQDAKEPNAKFTVDVPVAKFPLSQRLAQHTHMVIAVRNDSTRTIPDVAVTIVDPTLKDPTSAQAFGLNLSGQGSTPGLASRSRPIWVIDAPPGPCQYSCKSGGPGGAVTAYSNTWALGPLKPGATAKFDWAVTAIKPGTHWIQYQVAAGLNGKSRALLSGGGRPWGKFKVIISRQPQQSFVNDSGGIVKTP